MRRKKKPKSMFEINMVSGKRYYLFYDKCVELTYIESLAKEGCIHTFNGIIYCKHIEYIEKVK